MSDLAVQMSSLTHFSPARRVVLYNLLKQEVDKRGLTRVSTYVERARAHDRHTLKVEAKWESQTERHKFGAELPTLDPIADRHLRGIYRTAESWLDALDPQDPLAPRIRACLADAFPSGLGAITKASYVDQVAAMEACVDALTNEYAPLMSELSMTAMVDRLAAITTEYRAAVDGGHGRVEYAEVRPLRDRGHLYLVEIAAMITSEYHDSDLPAHAQTRAELLSLFHDHMEAERQERMERRARRKRARGDSDAPGDGDAPGAGSAPSDSGAPSTDASSDGSAPSSSTPGAGGSLAG